MVTRRRTSIRAGIVLANLAFLGILILPSNARAQQNCLGNGVVPQVTSFTISPSSIRAYSTSRDIALATVTLNCEIVFIINSYVVNFTDNAPGPFGSVLYYCTDLSTCELDGLPGFSQTIFSLHSKRSDYDCVSDNR